MSISRIKEEVKDGYLNDLPEDIQSKVMNIHKLIVSIAQKEFNSNKYDYLNKQEWAKQMMDAFLIMPSPNSQVGSVRVYKKGKRFRCMIQMTGHVNNNRNSEDEEFFHGLIRNIFTAVRPKVRRKFDMALTCESEHGEHFEGFDLFTKQKTAKEIWELFEDKTSKKIAPVNEAADTRNILIAEYHELPVGLQNLIESTSKELSWRYYLEDGGTLGDHTSYGIKVSESMRGNDVGFTVLEKAGDNYHGSIILSTEPEFESDEITESDDEFIDHSMERALHKYHESFTSANPGKDIILENKVFEMKLDDLYAEKLYHWLEENVVDLNCPGFKKINEKSIGDAYIDAAIDSLLESTFTEIIGGEKFTINKNGKEYEVYDKNGSFMGNYDSSYRVDIENELKDQDDPITESTDITTLKGIINLESAELLTETYEWDPMFESNNVPEYNVDMDEKQAKATLRTLSTDIINNVKNKKDYKVSQYTADIYANIITKNLLPLWAKGYRKFKIVLTSYQSFNTLEFKVPKLTQDFISRFIEGRESINGLLHRNPEITIKMSPRIIHNMKNPDDAFNFFRAAIRYYDQGIIRYSQQLMSTTMKLSREMKHLISTTKLSGVVSLPIQMLFIFDDVNISNKDTFKISKEDINTVNKFVNGIYTNYASPEKEKKKIVDDLNKVILALREKTEYAEKLSGMEALTEALTSFYSGGFDQLMESTKNDFIKENIDTEWMNNNPNAEIRVLQEKFGVKKLKKIPRDLIAYITIEAESIKDSNDKMMIASYCLSKLEIVEWYIELLEVGSKKYIVPHSKPYLEQVRRELLACYKNIMDTKIIPPGQRPLIQIQYPKGYEG